MTHDSKQRWSQVDRRCELDKFISGWEDTNPIGSIYAIRTDFVFQNIGTTVKPYPVSNHKNLEF